MSAGSFHHQTGTGMKQLKNTYDFPDFESVILSRGLSVTSNEGDFFSGKTE